jgi:hypothetical protein
MQDAFLFRTGKYIYFPMACLNLKSKSVKRYAFGLKKATLPPTQVLSWL